MKKVLVGLGLVMMTGCYSHSYTVGGGGDTSGEAAYDSWASHWFFGIIGGSNVNVNEVCPSGNATIEDKMSFLNGLIGSFVGVIWHPTTVTIYCDGGAAAPTSGGDVGGDTGDVGGDTGDVGGDSGDLGEGEPEASLQHQGRRVSFVLTQDDLQKLANSPQLMQYVRENAPERVAEMQAAIAKFQGGAAHMVAANPTTRM